MHTSSLIYANRDIPDGEMTASAFLLFIPVSIIPTVRLEAKGLVSNDDYSGLTKS